MRFYGEKAFIIQHATLGKTIEVTSTQKCSDGIKKTLRKNAFLPAITNFKPLTT
jgi:hypothetical protein